MIDAELLTELLAGRDRQDIHWSWSRAKQYVYFVMSDGFIKIGVSAQLRLRLADLQTGNPRPLEVLHTLEGTEETEHILHERFSAHRIQGEWFYPVPELLTLIRESQKSRAARDPAIRVHEMLTYAKAHNIEGKKSWEGHWRTHQEAQRFPFDPRREFGGEWPSWGRGLVRVRKSARWFTYEELVTYARSLGIQSRAEWLQKEVAKQLDARVPRERWLSQKYLGQWRGWHVLLGLPGQGRGRPPTITLPVSV